MRSDLELLIEKLTKEPIEIELEKAGLIIRED